MPEKIQTDFVYFSLEIMFYEVTEILQYIFKLQFEFEKNLNVL